MEQSTTQDEDVPASFSQVEAEQIITASQGSQGSAQPGEGAIPSRPLHELEEKLGYSFRQRDYLVNALIHKSYLHEVPDFALGSNERLEFLGDSVLGFIVSSDLFRGQPDRSEGDLSTLRGALVRLNTLAKLAAPLELGEYLYMSHGEQAAGGRSRGSSMGRAVEALLGAVYLDGGLEATEQVWHRISSEQGIEQLQQVISGDYKSRLQQFTQAHINATPEYRTVGTSGPDHAKQFHVEVLAGKRVLGGGVGRNKQIAEQAAARTALSTLEAELGSAQPTTPDGTQPDTNQQLTTNN